MTTTEVLRLQLDNLQREKQELEVRNLKLSENSSKEVLRDVEKERDHWKDECERITVENEQLKLLYEELFGQLPEGRTNPVDSGTGHCQAMAGLQEQLETQQNNLEQWECKCQELEKELSSLVHWKSRSGLLEKEINKLQQLNGELEKKISLVENNLELECFRAEAKERKQWEAREGRLVEYVAELQCQLKNKETGVEPLPLWIVDKTVEGSDNGSFKQQMQSNPPTHSAEASLIYIYTGAPTSQLGATQPTINIDSVSSVLLLNSFHLYLSLVER